MKRNLIFNIYPRIRVHWLTDSIMCLHVDFMGLGRRTGDSVGRENIYKCIETLVALM